MLEGAPVEDSRVDVQVAMGAVELGLGADAAAECVNPLGQIERETLSRPLLAEQVGSSDQDQRKKPERQGGAVSRDILALIKVAEDEERG